MTEEDFNKKLKLARLKHEEMRVDILKKKYLPVEHAERIYLMGFMMGRLV